MSYHFGQTPPDADIAAIRSGTPAAAAEILNETKKGMSKGLLLLGAVGLAYYLYRRFN